MHDLAQDHGLRAFFARILILVQAVLINATSLVDKDANVRLSVMNHAPVSLA